MRPIGSERQRAVLAHLIAAGGQVVPADELIEAVWGDRLPANPQNTLQHAIAQLRRAVEPERSSGQPATVLVSEGDGYRLDLIGHELDAAVFAASVGEASQLLDQAETRRALDALESGLRLWHGSAYSDVSSADAIDRERERLDGLRVTARVLVAEATESLHGSERAVPLLEELTSDYPLREGLWAKLMEALYRSGRQAEALGVYREVSDLLGEELGLVPSRALRDLEEAILVQDRGLARKPHSSVPVPAQRLIGRESELVALEGLLAENRLVTLFGPGGSGKTRLAIEAAGSLEPAHPDGVWFVRLDELEDGSLLAAKIGAGLGMPEDPERKVQDTLAGYLGDRAVALVLDNCEHLVDVVADLVVDLLASCPRLTILATSQRPLNVRAERRLPLSPLALPGEGDASPFEDLAEVPSVRLFVERALEVDPGFVAGPGALRAIANIVSALDGLPLAIELAAARTDLLTPEEIAVQLDDGFGVLRNGPRDLPDRQRTLRSALEWSFSLLEEAGQRCLAELAVFAGPFDLEAAAAVLDKRVELAQQILGEMVHRSLVARESTDIGSRFRMLGTLRRFGIEKLEGTGDEYETRLRHAEFYRDRVAHLDSLLTGSEQMAAYATLMADSEDIRAAMSWSLGSGRVDVGVPIAARAGRFWDWRGSLAEANVWFSRFVDARPVAGTPLLGAVLAWHAYIHLELGDLEKARAGVLQAQDAIATDDDAFAVGAAASVAAVVARRVGDSAKAMLFNDEVRSAGATIEDQWFGAWADNHDALCHLDMQDVGAAKVRAADSLRSFADIGDRRGVGWARTVIATVALVEGDVIRAAREAEAASDISFAVLDGRNAAWALEIAARAASLQDDDVNAAALRERAKSLLDERGVPFSPWNSGRAD